MSPTFGPTSRQAWIVQTYADQILNGALKPGEELPGIGALAKQWGVSKSTAQRALVELRDGNWIVTRAGKPSVVAPKPPTTGPTEADAAP